ncbi:MAG: AIR carboxylase family protein [bacterium]
MATARVVVVAGDTVELDALGPGLDLLLQWGIDFVGWHGWLITGEIGLRELFGLLAQSPQVVIATAKGDAELARALESCTTAPILIVPLHPDNCTDTSTLLNATELPPTLAAGTLAIGEAGAKNAALLAIQILALTDDALRDRLQTYRDQQRDTVLAASDPSTVN